MARQGRAEAVLVFNGCFCPVHNGHVAAMVDTKRKVEADGKCRVVAGYFAVATDGYVRRKLDGKLEPWMSAAARVDLCRAVADDVGWPISAAEFAGWKECGKAMIAQHHPADTQLISVRGEAKKGGVRKKGDGETAELSSTRIRAELSAQGRTPEVIDGLVGRKLLGRAVGERLKQLLWQEGQAEPEELEALREQLPTDSAAVPHSHSEAEPEEPEALREQLPTDSAVVPHSHPEARGAL